MRTDREVSVHDAKAALQRYEAFVSKQLTRTHWLSNPEYHRGKMDAREAWLQERREYLQQVLSMAVHRTTIERPASNELAG